MKPIWWVAVLCLFLTGCKGKLPKSLTTTVLPSSAASTATTFIKPGDPAPEVIGELVFGPNPSRTGISGQFTVLSRSFGLQSLPHYFYHYKLYPKVRWVYNVSKAQCENLDTAIKEQIKKGETVEGLSVVAHDNKTWPRWVSMMGQFLVIRDGKVVAECWENKLDETLMALIQNKFDTNAQLAKFYENQRDRLNFSKLSDPILQDYFAGRTNFATHTKQFAAILDLVQGDKLRAMAIRSYFSIQGCHPVQVMQPVYAKLRPSDDMSDIFRVTFIGHEGHYECRDRLEHDFALAMKDTKSFAASAEDCRTWTRNALTLGKKKEAQWLLKQMMQAKDIRPQYARALKARFEQDYENMMWRATH